MWDEVLAPVTLTVTVLSVLRTAPPQATVRTTSVQAGGNVPQPRHQLDQPRHQQGQCWPVLHCWGTPHLLTATRHSLMMETFRAGMRPTVLRTVLVQITGASCGYLEQEVEQAGDTITLLAAQYPTPGQIINP